MTKKKIIEFVDDDNTIYVEAQLPDTSNGSGFVASNPGETMIKATTSFSTALDPVMKFVTGFLSRIENLQIEKPTNIQLDFGIKLSGEVQFWVISGQGEGTINLKLTWKSDK